jgi:hypothetical protein
MLTVKRIDIINHEYCQEVDSYVVYSPESNIDPLNGVSAFGFDYTPDTICVGMGYRRGSLPCVLFKTHGVLWVQQLGDVYVMNDIGKTIASYHLPKRYPEKGT